MLPLATLWLVVGVVIGLAIARTFPAQLGYRPDPVDDEESDRDADRWERDLWRRSS